MIKTIHQKRVAKGMISVEQAFLSTIDGTGYETFNIPGMKSWGGTIFQAYEGNKEFRIEDYFPDYSGKANVITINEHFFMFIGDGPLRYKGEVI